MSNSSTPSSSSSSPSETAQLLIINKITQAQYPSVHPYVFRILIAYIIIYFFILLISILLILIPFYRGPTARRKHLWLWRRQYAAGQQYTIPYYVPNGGIAFVIAQIFGSIAFEVYMLLAYQSLKSPEFSRRSYQYFWLAIGNAPGCFGFWYSGFGALYTCIFSPSRSIEQGYKMERYLAHPIIMNIICVGTPMIPTLIALNWGITSIITEEEKLKAFDLVLFQVLSGIDPTLALLQYKQAGHAFLAQFKWACLSWSIAAILSVVFYSVTLLLFLRLLKKTVDLSTGKKSLLGDDVTTTTTTTTTTTKRALHQHQHQQHHDKHHDQHHDRHHHHHQDDHKGRVMKWSKTKSLSTRIIIKPKKCQKEEEQEQQKQQQQQRGEEQEDEEEEEEEHQEQRNPSTSLKNEVVVVTVAQNSVGGIPGLRKSYHLLMWQCVLLMIVSVWYTVDGLVLLVMIEKVPTSIGWRSLSAWLVVSSSFLLALALCLQSWRMIADKNDPSSRPSPPPPPHHHRHYHHHHHRQQQHHHQHRQQRQQQQHHHLDKPSLFEMESSHTQNTLMNISSSLH